jgi:hypothetical protein
MRNGVELNSRDEITVNGVRPGAWRLSVVALGGKLMQIMQTWKALAGHVALFLLGLYSIRQLFSFRYVLLDVSLLLIQEFVVLLVYGLMFGFAIDRFLTARNHKVTQAALQSMKRRDPKLLMSHLLSLSRSIQALAGQRALDEDEMDHLVFLQKYFWLGVERLIAQEWIPQHCLAELLIAKAREEQAEEALFCTVVSQGETRRIHIPHWPVDRGV